MNWCQTLWFVFCYIESPSPKPDRWDREFLPDYEQISDDEDKTQSEINAELQAVTDKTREKILFWVSKYISIPR